MPAKYLFQQLQIGKQAEMLDASVFIPPLNLTSKDDPTYSKSSIFCLRNEGEGGKSLLQLHRNSQFMHEKSLYRYYIAQNRCTALKETSILPPSTPPNRLQMQGSRYQMSRVLSQTHLKLQQDAGCEAMKAEVNRDKHFKRKNRLNRTQFQGMKPQREEPTIDNEEEHTEKSLNDMHDHPMLKSLSTVSFQEGREGDITWISRENQLLSHQNTLLKQKLVEKQAIITELSARVRALQEERGILETRLEAITEQIGSNTDEQAQLRDQLSEKDLMMQKLQSGYRYMEIENTMLKHAKMQCSMQLNLIGQLEREKKVLEEKIRLLYELNKKKKKSKASLKEDSEISLALSLSTEREGRGDEAPSASIMQRGEWSDRTSFSPGFP